MSGSIDKKLRPSRRVKMEIEETIPTSSKPKSPDLFKDMESLYKEIETQQH